MVTSGVGREQGSLLFLKKKKQKDFYPLALSPTILPRCKRTKVFWLFFKKERAF
jgi:hypothetical protein